MTQYLTQISIYRNLSNLISRSISWLSNFEQAQLRSNSSKLYNLHSNPSNLLSNNFWHLLYNQIYTRQNLYHNVNLQIKTSWSTCSNPSNVNKHLLKHSGPQANENLKRKWIKINRKQLQIPKLKLQIADAVLALKKV